MCHCCILCAEDDLQLVGIVKDETMFYSDSSKDGVFDWNVSMNNGSDVELTLDPIQQYREMLDAANLRTWSPNGLFPKLPSCVQPLLHGAPMSAERHKALSARLRDEIIRFLKASSFSVSVLAERPRSGE
ncbi:hypothetical protein V5799_013359 [Amblyomma americanum]|uniref:Uncharacterized protein n=1 Tax=Amblyomma americanum TaxID=6943 RepID=A0AAQ4E640_AMBAM